jgi:H+/Cl- antiporter ClcA
MQLRIKRVLVATLVSITLVSFVFALASDDKISLSQLTPFWIVLLVGSACFSTFFFFIVLGLRKNEEYLRKVKKWDSPKRVSLNVILVWVVIGILYYIRPKIWFFFYALSISIAYVSAAYLRNEYRKQLTVQPR